MRPPVALFTLAILAHGAPALAQPHTSEAPTWRVQPSVGILLDAYDDRPDGSRAGALVGVEVGRRLTDRVRGVASLAVARVDDVGPRPPVAAAYRVYRHDWLFASLGAAAELPVRRATLSLSLQGGAAWRRTPDVRLVGTPTAEAEGPFGPPAWLRPDGGERWVTGVVVPGASVRLPVARPLAFVGDARAYWTSFDEGGRVSPAFALGLSWAP